MKMTVMSRRNNPLKNSVVRILGWDRRPKKMVHQQITKPMIIMRDIERNSSEVKCMIGKGLRLREPGFRGCYYSEIRHFSAADSAISGRFLGTLVSD
jgi:hypothetical protein